MQMYSTIIAFVEINITSLNQKESLENFIFTNKDVVRTLGMIGWTGRSARSGYICTPITKKCFDLYKLGTSVRQVCLIEQYGMFAFHISKIMWEVLK